MVKLQKRLNRKIGDKEYAKWIVSLPPDMIDTLNLKESQEINLVYKDGNIILQPKSPLPPSVFEEIAKIDSGIGVMASLAAINDFLLQGSFDFKRFFTNTRTMMLLEEAYFGPKRNYVSSQVCNSKIPEILLLGEGIDEKLLSKECVKPFVDSSDYLTTFSHVPYKKGCYNVGKSKHARDPLLTPTSVIDYFTKLFWPPTTSSYQFHLADNQEKKISAEENIKNQLLIPRLVHTFSIYREIYNQNLSAKACLLDPSLRDIGKVYNNIVNLPLVTLHKENTRDKNESVILYNFSYFNTVTDNNLELINEDVRKLLGCTFEEDIRINSLLEQCNQFCTNKTKKCYPVQILTRSSNPKEFTVLNMIFFSLDAYELFSERKGKLREFVERYLDKKMRVTNYHVDTTLNPVELITKEKSDVN